MQIIWIRWEEEQGLRSAICCAVREMHAGALTYVPKWNAGLRKHFFYANWAWLVQRPRPEQDTDTY